MAKKKEKLDLNGDMKDISGGAFLRPGEAREIAGARRVQELERRRMTEREEELEALRGTGNVADTVRRLSER